VNIFFDVDYTLITWDVKLRPGVREVFDRLRSDGHTIYLWSGVGPRWEVVRRFELHDHVADCFWKPLYNHHARMAELGVTVTPDYVIDDHQEIVDVFVGTRIAEPRMPLDGDTEMWRVYEDIAAYVRSTGEPGAEAAS
jgi:hypothetical protein